MPAPRYQIPQNDETEFQPGSRGRVLRNKPGISNKREIDRLEYSALIAAQEKLLRSVTADTRFTAELVREMHRTWLGEIYSWAGEYRTIDLTKGSFTWPSASLVCANMLKLEEGALREHTPLRPAPLPELARRIAVVHGELLLIHPFREGNGRLARWLADLMGFQAGLPPARFNFAGPGSKGRFGRYVQAVGKAYLQDYAALSDLFAEAFEAGRRRAER